MSGRVRVKKDLGRLIKFQRINLMDSQWALEGLFDAIFFRNALIYFNQDTQEIFLRKMLRYLKPGGYLILGHSEHVPWLNDAVEAIGHTIHRLRAGRGPAPVPGSRHRNEASPRVKEAGANRVSAPPWSAVGAEKAHLYWRDCGQRNAVSVANPSGFVRGGVSSRPGYGCRRNESHPASREMRRRAPRAAE